MFFLLIFFIEFFVIWRVPFRFLRIVSRVYVVYRHVVFIQKAGKVCPIDAEMAAGEFECRQLPGVNPAQYSSIADTTAFGDEADGYKLRCPLIVSFLQS